MTGMEWAVCDDPRLMVDALRRQCSISDRKWRLFVAAFWRWRGDHLKGIRDEVIEIADLMESWGETGRLAKGQRSSRAQDVIFFAEDAAVSAMRTAQEPFLWLQGDQGATA